LLGGLLLYDSVSRLAGYEPVDWLMGMLGKTAQPDPGRAVTPGHDDGLDGAVQLGDGDLQRHLHRVAPPASTQGGGDMQGWLFQWHLISAMELGDGAG